MNIKATIVLVIYSNYSSFSWGWLLLNLDSSPLSGHVTAHPITAAPAYHPNSGQQQPFNLTIQIHSACWWQRQHTVFHFYQISVNGCTPKKSFLGIHKKMHLPSASDFCDIIRKAGRGFFLFATDVARATASFPRTPETGLSSVYFGWPFYCRHQSPLWGWDGQLLTAKTPPAWCPGNWRGGASPSSITLMIFGGWPPL